MRKLEMISRLSFSGNCRNCRLTDKIPVIKRAVLLLMTDRVALVELFELTLGKYWYQKWNWNSNEGYRQWFGIRIDVAGHVEAINLRENNLRGSISEFHSIALLVNLRSLSLFSNSLSGSLPNEFGRCSHLREVNLSWNHICGELPDSFYDLKELRMLKIDHNEFSGELSNKLSNLKELCLLDISHNSFSGIYCTRCLRTYFYSSILAGKIPFVANDLEFLTSIDVASNNFEGIRPLNSFFSSLSYFNLPEPIPKSVKEFKEMYSKAEI